MPRPRLLLAACLSLLARPAPATTARQLSLARLVHGSDTTLAGTVLDATSFWQGSRIYTLTQVRVDDVWVGTVVGPGTQLGVLTLGGRVGDIGQRVDGAAVLRPRHSVVLHLRHQAGGEFVTYGMAQGVWEVDAAAPARVPRQVARPHVDALVSRGAPQPRWPATLPELKEAVLAAAALAPPAGPP